MRSYRLQWCLYGPPAFVLEVKRIVSADFSFPLSLSSEAIISTNFLTSFAVLVLPRICKEIYKVLFIFLAFLLKVTRDLRRKEKKNCLKTKLFLPVKLSVKYSNPGILSFLHWKESSENMCVCERETERKGKREMGREMERERAEGEWRKKCLYELVAVSCGSLTVTFLFEGWISYCGNRIIINGGKDEHFNEKHYQ